MKVIHVVSVSGGKDSLATLLIALERCGHANVVAIFCDTGNEHEETYAYLDYLERALGIQIIRLKADFSEQLLAKRMFIARDVRTAREVERVVCLDVAGQPLPARRPGDGAIITKQVMRKDGTVETMVVPKTRKVTTRRIRWSNRAKRRALAVMYPSGNPFLDLCMWKGRFPSRKAQFCTEELKRNMAVGYQLELLEAGHRVISWQGIRRDESQNRANAKKWERVGPGMWIARPIVDATAADVFALARERGLRPNPLYLQRMSRVGCMPCINCNKAELRAIAARFPEHPSRIAHWEWLVGQCSKRGFATFMADAHSAKDRRQIFADLNIWARIEWSKTTRGGRQFNLLDEEENEGGGCSSSYGLCEQGEPLTELEAA
ncbi:3'-phosphoadenosine 5'-phosphosulfate sulfotransferase (PAPS reductase)/FAD synthetase [Pseudacidovorax sp. 1753]|uniref:phosphoadenosine phosphosulfate reductase family protein n=1 Tax=Pseudacidovorax sp. 1753 TaxID=3156419 RepID=UPI0033938D1A